MISRRVVCVVPAGLALLLGGCGGSQPDAHTAPLTAAHSASLALDKNDRQLFVVNPDADSISVIDVEQRVLKREIRLAPDVAAAEPDAGVQAFAPSVMPRAAALSPDDRTLYVTGERSGALHVIDVESGTVKRIIPVGSEPIGLVVSPDGKSIFVACSADATVVRIDAASLKLTATAHVAPTPWALAWSADASKLLVSHFLGPGVTPLDPVTLSAGSVWKIPGTAPRGDKRLAHGEVRGLYDAAARPGTKELWVTHALLGTDTAQPDLDFESTAFPALSLLRGDGSYQQTLTTDAQDVPGIDGSFADVVSGPHALAFTHDGDYLLMVDTNSEDVMIIDARRRIETALVRPLPGKLPEGIVLSSDEHYAYLDQRNSGDVAVLRLDRTESALNAVVDGTPIARLMADPMPAHLRLGQQLFYSANSSEYPLTTDHWIACATCHMEGRSDAVTWKFAQGPRDTPSNAGGMLGTGFLFRTADRNQVQDYWHTINIEQGGRFDPKAQSSLLDAISDYVNYAIPLPIPPTTDPDLVAHGAQIFKDAGCATCHSGARFTDSGAGNDNLDLGGAVLLHDIGACVTDGAFPDVAHKDVDDHPRAACDFDTPSLNGVASSPPYLHDGSAATLADANALQPNAPTSADDSAALVEYLRSL